MKLPNPYKCDECGMIKQPSNGWIIGFTDKFAVDNPEDQAGHDAKVVLVAWSDEAADEEGATHLCGIECVTRFVAKNISKQ